MIYQLVKRDFQQRYVGSAAGWLWGLVHPLVLLGSYTFIFSVCLKMKPGANQVTQNYPMFLFAGMLPWLLFSETVQRSSGSLVEQAHLITKTVFPAEIIPVSIFLSSLISHLLALLLAMFAAIVALRHFSLGVAVLPAFMFFLGLFAIGIGWIVSSLQVYLRDTAQIMMVILTLWFWVTPILIDESQFPRWAEFALRVNPLAYIVRAYRELLLGNGLPPWPDFAITFAFSALAFVAGGLFFRHVKRGFADVL